MCLNNLKPLSNNSKEHLERCRNCRIAPVPVRPVSCQTLIPKRVGPGGASWAFFHAAGAKNAAL